MATTLTVTPIDRDGIAGLLSGGDLAGNNFPNSGNAFIEVTNASGGAITVTIPIVPTIDDQPVDARVVSVPNGERRIIGPFPMGTYNDSNGRVNFTLSVAGVTVGVGVFTLTPE